MRSLYSPVPKQDKLATQARPPASRHKKLQAGILWRSSNAGRYISSFRTFRPASAQDSFLNPWDSIDISWGNNFNTLSSSYISVVNLEWVHLTLGTTSPAGLALPTWPAWMAKPNPLPERSLSSSLSLSLADCLSINLPSLTCMSLCVWSMILIRWLVYNKLALCVKALHIAAIVYST